MPCTGSPHNDAVKVELESKSLIGVQTIIAESCLVEIIGGVTVGGVWRRVIMIESVTFVHKPVLSQTRTQIWSLP